MVMSSLKIVQSYISFEIYQVLEKCLPELVKGDIGGELELVKKGGVAA